jgi:hypothetical protein
VRFGFFPEQTHRLILAITANSAAEELSAPLLFIKRFEAIAAGKRKILEDLRTSAEGFS